MGKVEEFTDDLEALMGKLKEGPGALINDAKAKFGELKDKIENIKAEDVTPPGPAGMLVGCAVSGMVENAKKLGEDVSTMAKSMSQMGDGAKESLDNVKKTMDSAMESLEKAITGLAKLPKTVAAELNGKDSPDDIAKINTDNMKKALAGGDMDGPLTSIKGVTKVLGDVVSLIGKCVGELSEFLGTFATKLKDAFKVPTPFCCIDVQPDALKQMLAMLDAVAAIDFNAFVNILQKAADSIGAIDTDAIKTPVNKFMESAGGLVDKLENTVKGAKMASGGGAGAIGGIV